MIEAIIEAIVFILNTIGQIIIGIPQMLGIDEWYIFYIALAAIGGIGAWIRSKIK